MARVSGRVRGRLDAPALQLTTPLLPPKAAPLCATPLAAPLCATPPLAAAVPLATAVPPVVFVRDILSLW